MTSRRRWTGTRAARFLGLSILGHTLILVVMATTGLGRGCAGGGLGELGSLVPREVTPIDVRLIEPTVPNPYATRPTPEEELRTTELKIAEARKPEEQRDLGGQVVDIAKPEVEIRPDDSAKFLAEYDNKVDKETKGKPGQDQAGARQQKRPASAANPTPPSRASPPRQEVAPVAPRPDTRGQNGSGDKGALAMRPTQPNPEAPRGKEGGLESSANEGTEVRKGETPPDKASEGGVRGVDQSGRAGREGQDGAPGSPDSVPQVGDLRPSDDTVAQAVGVGSSDYLKDVDEGADTLLNTKRWKFASFFTRVKHGVAHTWRPDVAYRLRDPTGQIYGQKNRFTVLKVSLKPDGSLRDVLVEKGCGVDFLDDEAITAFREAQPFPNPPPGLVDEESKLITFRFGFYFEISGSPTFRVFRQ